MTDFTTENKLLQMKLFTAQFLHNIVSTAISVPIDEGSI